MAIEFILTKDPIDQEEYDQFIADFGLNIPAEYRDHILQINGGAPFPNYFVREEDDAEFGIAHFFYIKNGSNTLEKLLDNLYDEEDPVLSRDFFPFAYDQGGNYFCIRLDGVHYGNVYMVYMDNSEPQFLAITFRAFLDGIQEDPEYIL